MVDEVFSNSFIERLKINEQHRENHNSSTTSTTQQYSPYKPLTINKPILQYKKWEEYTQYSKCLVTYLDHPSAIFIQIPDDGPAFQKMHQDMNRYYSTNNQGTATFNIGDFCVTYSIRYSEFYRARIITIDTIHELYLVVFVDFGNSEWIIKRNVYPLRTELTQLKIQSIAVTLSNIVPKKDPETGSVHWKTNIGKQCIRKLRHLLINPNGEPYLFVSITFLPNEKGWPLPFVEIKLDDQDIAQILHNDGFARLTRNNQDLKTIYPDFGIHCEEQLIFGIHPSTNHHPNFQ